MSEIQSVSDESFGVEAFGRTWSTAERKMATLRVGMKFMKLGGICTTAVLAIGAFDGTDGIPFPPNSTGGWVAKAGEAYLIYSALANHAPRAFNDVVDASQLHQQLWQQHHLETDQREA